MCMEKYLCVVSEVSHKKKKVSHSAQDSTVK